MPQHSAYPEMFYPKLGPDAVCAMPSIGVILVLWILGGLVAIATHVIYLIVTRKKIELKTGEDKLPTTMYIINCWPLFKFKYLPSIQRLLTVDRFYNAIPPLLIC